jgi:adenylosuccinate lyase
MDELSSISPLDGRYYAKLQDLSGYFSEFALIKKRVYVELKYLIELGKAKENIMQIHEKFDLVEAKKVKEIEKTTNHDVKAVEYYIKEKVSKEIKEFIHYGLTSEDINNLAYSLLFKEFIEKEYTEKVKLLLDKLKKLSHENRSVAMLARTHGQVASPTILGKEFFVFYSRISGQFEKLKKIELTGKLNGATGNYNALVFAEPKIDWIEFSRKFIIKLGLESNLITTQIEPHDTLVELFHAVKRINNIVLDLDVDIWHYISMDYLSLRKKEGEVGSSTMPHKVNPIDFENSEGNIKIANSLFTGLESLQMSRMQRDLSDSTMMRNIGVAFGHTILAYDSTLKGLEKIVPSLEKITNDLEDHPEVLTEVVQTVLRKYGKSEAYEKLKDFSRGKKVTLDELHNFIDALDLDKKEKDRLKKLKVRDYIGLADKF